MKPGLVPKLTPVRSQVMGPQLATLEAGDITLSLEWTPASTVERFFRRRAGERSGMGEAWPLRLLSGGGRMAR